MSKLSKFTIYIHRSINCYIHYIRFLSLLVDKSFFVSFPYFTLNVTMHLNELLSKILILIANQDRCLFTLSD